MDINKEKLNDFLGVEEEENQKVIKKDKSLVERIDKKIIVEGGKQLLI